MKKQIKIKVISMGNPEVGKSCIIKRYCEKRFVHKYLSTIGIDYGVTKIEVDDKLMKVHIFDMAGHPVFYEVRNEFYRDAQGALLVYDVSSKSSFESLNTWLQELRNEIGDALDAENMTVVVCANKVDKKRQVSEADGRLWAQSKGFLYFDTSAQTGEGVTEVFQALLRGILQVVELGSRAKPDLAYSQEQADAIWKLKNARTDFEKLGLTAGASKRILEEITAFDSLYMT